VRIVEYALSERIASVALNRPERLNAETAALTEGLLDALGRARADGAPAVVLSGNGRAFCAGHDLVEPEPVGEDEARSRARLSRLQDVTRAVRGYPGVVIAAVHGYALGAGCEFALTCDLVVAAADAQFGFPEVGVGLSVTGGISAYLPRAVGLARAKELVILGERFGAEQAMQWGLVNRVAPAGEHLAVAQQLARACRDRPPLALQLAKTALDEGSDGDLQAALAREVDHAMRTLGSGESDAARSSFRRDDR
jgi:enoyl-CoA hydratase/carnithine racemase